MDEKQKLQKQKTFQNHYGKGARSETFYGLGCSNADLYDDHSVQQCGTGKPADPAKEDTGLFFFRGNTGEKFAVCNARAVRFIRKNADVYGIDPDAIAVMGKSIDRQLLSGNIISRRN